MPTCSWGGKGPCRVHIVSRGAHLWYVLISATAYTLSRRGAEVRGSFLNKWNILRNSVKQNGHEISSFSLGPSVVQTARAAIVLDPFHWHVVVINLLSVGYIVSTASRSCWRVFICCSLTSLSSADLVASRYLICCTLHGLSLFS